MASIRALVVDDHEPFRRAVPAMVGAAAGFAVVGEVGDGRRPSWRLTYCGPCERSSTQAALEAQLLAAGQIPRRTS